MAFRYGKQETADSKKKLPVESEDERLKIALSALDRANKMIKKWHLEKSTASGAVGAGSKGSKDANLKGSRLSQEEELRKRRQLNKTQRAKMQDWEN